MNTNRIGDISEHYVTARLLELGKNVSRPVGNNCRYDVLVDNADGTFTRGQVKTGRLRNGVIRFSTKSTHVHTGECFDYLGQVDVFYIYCPELDKVYAVPITRIGTSQKSLRITRSKFCNDKQTDFAEDYEL
jgi:hypothetical protein